MGIKGIQANKRMKVAQATRVRSLAYQVYVFSVNANQLPNYSSVRVEVYWLLQLLTR